MSAYKPPSTVSARERRQKLVGREITKLLVAMEMDLLGLDERLAMALTDWEDIPDNWLRRTCARARKAAHFYPRPAEILDAYRAAKEARYKRLKALDSARNLKRLPPPRMSDEERQGLMRGLYASLGVNYDLEIKRREFEKEVAHKRRTP